MLAPPQTFLIRVSHRYRARNCLTEDANSAIIWQKNGHQVSLLTGGGVGGRDQMRIGIIATKHSGSISGRAHGDR
jgi:hypothetical protein